MGRVRGRTRIGICVSEGARCGAGIRSHLCRRARLAAASANAILYNESAAQVIVMELLMDVGASAAFTVEGPDEDLMAVPPRSAARRLFDARLCGEVAVVGASLGGCVLAAFAASVLGGGGGTAETQTTCFAAWLAGHVLVAFAARSGSGPVLLKGLLGNAAMNAWAAAAGAVLALLAFSPGFQVVVRCAPLGGRAWAVVAGAALCGAGAREAWRWLALAASRARRGDAPAPAPLIDVAAAA